METLGRLQIDCQKTQGNEMSGLGVSGSDTSVTHWESSEGRESRDPSSFTAFPETEAGADGALDAATMVGAVATETVDCADDAATDETGDELLTPRRASTAAKTDGTLVT